MVTMVLRVAQTLTLNHGESGDTVIKAIPLHLRGLSHLPHAVPMLHLGTLWCPLQAQSCISLQLSPHNVSEPVVIRALLRRSGF